MVCEKNEGIEHDFYKDPIRLKMDGEWLKAEGTTLGADNGIGVATALSLMELGNDIPLPSLEFLFTVEEEIGLIGADKLDNEALQIRSKTMINMDAEEWGQICIGCAGGADQLVTLPITYRTDEPFQDKCYVKLEVKGFQGGHSGINIHEDRANAVITLAKLVRIAFYDGCEICTIQGGDKGNAIPREARCTLLIPKEKLTEIKKKLQNKWDYLQQEYGVFEVGMMMEMADISEEEGNGFNVLSREKGEKLIQLLLTLPHGPIKLSHVAKGLVETSTNLASVKLTDKGYNIVCKPRSSMIGPLEDILFKIESIGKLCGSEVDTSGFYPGWSPNPKSALLEDLKKVYTEVLDGSIPEVTAVHAGLECGILMEKLGEIDMIAYGPTILGAHSPDERVHIESVDKFWQLTLKLLEKISKQQP
eukprot:TRINITY_DN780_c0_g1_i8.p1 TRINITY_DN780_c0_g1~~TRINITY_DN780_c0_g1_i8.p1  ORF type:complete len:464 (+),score=76.31 TRINITY_DN780_c0_g1_i8:138-1394(+)